ncbi:MAG TPA: DUF1707 domain-containing protein [Acidimicrobiales bacterium]|nr:DUF1707 domain-containing protein [Acidimicrobiales bacterium]
MEGRDIRATDAERRALVDALSTACADGQLTLDEFSERSGEAWAAITRGQLDDITHDLRLPVVATTAARAAAEATPSTDRPPRRRRWIVAIMGGEHQRGRWRADRRVGAMALMGGIHIDLRDATLDSDEVDITAWALMGSVHVTVPEGIPVDFSGFMFMGGRSNRVSRVEPLRGAPTIRLRGYGIWGTITVHSRPPRQPGEPEPPDEIIDVPHWLPTPPPHSSSRRVEAGGLVTVVCTDIVGSTRMADSLGDQRWRTVLREHYAMARAEASAHGGTEIKTRGDGLLLTFDSPRRAVQFAVAFQARLAKERAADPAFALQARVGVHAGEVERDGEDVVGRNVSVACRLCDAAESDEVLTSAVVADLADSASDLSFGPARELMLAGIERPMHARPATSRC